MIGDEFGLSDKTEEEVKENNQPAPESEKTEKETEGFLAGYTEDEQRKIIGLAIILVALLLHMLTQFAEDHKQHQLAENMKIFSAARAGKVEKVKEFIEKGVDVDIKSASNDTPLNVACLSKSAETVRYLIKKGADVNTYNQNFVSPIHRVVVHKRLEMLKALIKAKVDVNSSDSKKLTPLHYAAFKNFKEAVPLLIGAGANPNAQDKQGNTALHVAIGEKNIDLAVSLTVNGAKSDIKNIKDAKPSDYASTHEKMELARKLSNATVKSEQKQTGKWLRD